jgi:hypothetical protein
MLFLRKPAMILTLCRLALTLAVLLGLAAAPPATAQQPSPPLLINGDLETPYYAQGAATRTVPQGWGLWIGAGTPDALPHTDRPQVHSGTVSWHLRQDGVAFAAAGYQQVSAIAPGTRLELVAHGWVFACDDPAARCAISVPPYAQSDERADTVLRVGIDPTGSLDPLAPAVQWSAEAAPFDRWAALRVTAIAQAETVTVYLFATQQTALALNSVYWDTVSLAAVPGADATGGQALAPTATPSPAPTLTATPLPPPTAVPTLPPPPPALAAETGTLCAAAFHDENLNATRDPGEGPLPGLRVLVTGQQSVETLSSAETLDPLCVTLAPGVYEVAALPPDGFGLTGPGAALVTVSAGRKVAIVFGAAQGYAATRVPTSDAPTAQPGAVDVGLVAPPLDAGADANEGDGALLDPLYEYSGLLVLAVAVLIGGGGALVLLALRRPA